jgi:methionyl-tRNA synthetase
MKDVKRSPIRGRKLSKTIETGRVEEGSHSDQKFQSVNKSFDHFPFHTVEYKLMPISQKLNTVADINVKRYCTNCGHKLAKTNNFCSKCGKKA